MRGLLIGNSVVFGAACLFFGGVMLSGFADWNPLSWFAAAMFGPPAFVLAISEYAAILDKQRLAAKYLPALLLLTVGGVLVAAASVTVKSLVGGELPTWDYLPAEVLLVVLLPAWLCWMGLVNLIWLGQFVEKLIGGANRFSIRALRTRCRIGLRGLLAFVAGVSIVLAGVAFGVREIRPRHAVHVSARVARLDLPPAANDVRILRGFGGSAAFDFAIDEAGFRRWAESLDDSRGGDAKDSLPKPIINPFTIVACPDDQAADVICHTIRRGWCRDELDDDRAMQYAYDADLGRAYYVGCWY